jgi:hypothetical protein
MLTCCGESMIICCGESMLICCVIFELLDNYATGFRIHIKCNILVRGPLWRKVKLLTWKPRPSVCPWHCASHQTFCRCLWTALYL